MVETTWATARLDDIIGGAELPPVIRTWQLGALDSWGSGWIRKTWEPSADLLNWDGSVFGGSIAALADQSLAFAAMTVVPADKVFRTINLTTSFYRVGGNGAMHIEAKVVSQSRQLIHTRAEFRNVEGELLAEAAAQQVLQKLG